MNRSELVKRLNSYLLELLQVEAGDVPADLNSQRKLLRALMNICPPHKSGRDF